MKEEALGEKQTKVEEKIICKNVSKIPGGELTRSRATMSALMSFLFETIALVSDVSTARMLLGTLM